MGFIIGLILIGVAVAVFLKLRKKKKAEQAATVAPPAAASTAVVEAPKAPAVVTNSGAKASITVYYDPNCPDWPAQKAEYLKKYPDAVFIPQS